MGASLSITSQTDGQFNGVREICVRNDSIGINVEVRIVEDRQGRWRSCTSAAQIAVRQEKCVDFLACGELYEGLQDFQVRIVQTFGTSMTYEQDFVYSEFGKRVTFQITGSRVSNDKGSVTGTTDLNPPIEACINSKCYVVPHVTDTRTLMQKAFAEPGVAILPSSIPRTNRKSPTLIYDGSTSVVPTSDAWIGIYEYDGPNQPSSI